jgi:hypothetical protein
MDVTIIGAGNMARGIATRALAGGNTVTLLDRDPAKASALAGELGGATRTGAYGEPLTGEAVVLAVPYSALADVLGRYGGDLAGRIVIDITNPLDFATFEPIHPAAGSAAQEIAATQPAAKVVKAFNTTFAGTLVSGVVAGRPLDVFLAGDDEQAKAEVARLVEAGGLRAIDAGPLRRAREVEALGYLHIALQQPLKTGFASAVGVSA